MGEDSYYQKLGDLYQTNVDSNQLLEIPIKSTEQTIWIKIIYNIILIYFFLLGIKLLESTIGLLGPGVASYLVNLTRNPIIGLFVGILATSIVQSSSATSSIVVGIVSAGTIPLQNAVPIIMGANIGTTITNTLVSLTHLRNKREFGLAFSAATLHDYFNILTVAVLLPLELVFGILSKSSLYLANLVYGTTSFPEVLHPVNTLIMPIVEGLQILSFHSPILMLIISLSFIILSLICIVRNMKGLVATKFHQIIQSSLDRPIVSLLVGVFVTILVQSSSITTSLLVPLAGSGLLSLETIFPITIGANIGTTVTSLIAALSGNIYGLAVAFVHLLFNLLGLLLWYPIPSMRQIPIRLSKALAKMAQEHTTMTLIYLSCVFFVIPSAIVYFARTI